MFMKSEYQWNKAYTSTSLIPDNITQLGTCNLPLADSEKTSTSQTGTTFVFIYIWEASHQNDKVYLGVYKATYVYPED